MEKKRPSEHASNGEPTPKRTKLGPRTTVVKLRRSRGVVVQGCDVYIGRECVLGGWNLPHSKWANPFSISRCGTAKAAVQRYRDYIATKPELLAEVGELRGKVLGCWCKPGPCHGDVLRELADVAKE